MGHPIFVLDLKLVKWEAPEYEANKVKPEA
jgi:hypothetical protein